MSQNEQHPSLIALKYQLNEQKSSNTSRKSLMLHVQHFVFIVRLRHNSAGVRHGPLI